VMGKEASRILDMFQDPIKYMKTRVGRSKKIYFQTQTEAVPDRS